MKLPKDFVDEGLRISKESTIMGVAFSDLSRDELIAAAAHGWTAYHEGMRENLRAIEMFRFMGRTP